ncbi:GntR family transcriptional regulator [Litoreibacter meonggei]|uniref:GntR family transcriptional regulator n=1 Tax=Litoreibacter meonggei TaxID=1049199 RepID=A0A497VTC5_9RHOB|nr:GntR family transcriptional regulator [Litoreibacter meonggei]RLJ41269.1 GntR family transcriptional regulator [Litoreibacter meonggei]
MSQFTNLTERRTSIDDIFDTLHEDIVTLKLMPGTKISEAEIANQFSVSRQPVRDAFSRLGNLGLLLIRPQKATVVRKFSIPEIFHARFVRTAIEVEVLRTAVLKWSDTDTTPIRENMKQQVAAVKAQDTDRFHGLDYEFHKLLCAAAGFEMAFETIAEMKTKVDRLCRLSLEEPTEMKVLLEDHERILSGLDSNDFSALETVIRTHLARLDSVVEKVRLQHSEYFE